MELSTWQQNEKAAAEALAAELMAVGVPGLETRVEIVSENFTVIVRYNGQEYTARRDFKGYLDVFAYPHKRYPHVSNSTYHEVRKKHEPKQRTKALSPRKIIGELEAVRAWRDEMLEREAAAVESRERFLAEVRKKTNDYKLYTDRNTGEFTGGSVKRGGLEFVFSFHEDGHIRQEIEVSYTVKDTLENFLALADNKYEGEE